MPLSTSNSNSRCPQKPYLKLWLITLSLFVFVGGCSEIYWRNAGFLTTIVDTKLFWSKHRHHVYTQQNRKKLVIVGSSRAQLGIDPTVLENTFPEFDSVHLAIDGALPYDVIKDLCLDPTFDGFILADVTVPFLCMTDTLSTQKEREYIAYYHTTFQTGAALEKHLNSHIQAWLQDHLVTHSPTLSFKSLLYNRFSPQWLYYHMQWNRYRPAYYYDRMSPQERQLHRQKRIERLLKNPIKRVSFSKFEQIAQHDLRPLYEQLLQRGGNMVLVRMPTTGKHWQIDEQMAPKNLYWDKLETLSGIPSIHFKDDKQLAAFDCPDTSHLDATDVPLFTQRLGHLIRLKWHLSIPQQ